MTDAPTRWLLEQIKQHANSQSLWLSDENVLRLLPDAQTWPAKPQFVSNRWDIAAQAKQLGFHSLFNDFDLSAIADNSLDQVFYRISKEKAVTHHLINQARRILKPGGCLWLSGQKNDGIKTYIEKASVLFGCEKHIQKDGPSYSSSIQKINTSAPPLEDDNYSELRHCIEIGGHQLASKPGQFGWNKIDLGSEFLIAELSKLLAEHPATFEHCLDLGCGYGYLSIASQGLPIKARTLTDNNAAALYSAQHNCAQLAITADIIASDAGQQLNRQFDLILCNPPFHQGFSVDGDLTDKFLQSAKNLLTDNGVAYFVVNQFIPLEKKAEPLFKQVQLIAKNKSFKVFQLRKN